MRAGGNCAVQQALTPEALGVLKQAITVARGRGHAQVTPLHVANTMLLSPTGFLKTACLQSQSHSHPLQCKALELCFNVALNRLPTSSSVSPMFGPHSHSPKQNHPTVSNALVAAFKRAQAHQRRGSIENQQQPILAIKIELEQLIISILDDPSVSRVMREAGFSSTQVKSSVEKSVSLMESTQPSNYKSKVVSRPKASNQVKDEDLTVLIDNMIATNKRSRKKSIVIVGEWLESIEGVVGALMDKFDRGEVPQDLKDMKFISLPLYSIENRSRDEVEKKLVELKCLVKSCVERGVVLYLGDLKWIADFRVLDDDDHDSNHEVGRVMNCYCPVEHMVIELGRLVSGIGDSENFWLLSIATFQTFIRCKKGNPSLESIWGLHPLTIPQGSLALSLVPIERNNHDKHQPTFCPQCSSCFEAEARILQNSEATAAVTTLPPWLQLSKENNQHPKKDSKKVNDLFTKWTSYCKSLHKQPNSSSLEMAINFSPSSSPYDWRDRQPDQYVQNGFFSNPNSATSSDVIMENEYVKCFKELTPHNIDILCHALENKVPWQKDIMAPIASTILQCRSGNISRRKGSVAKRDGEFNGRSKEETWLLFEGLDLDGKCKLARELARVVFGSQSNLVTIALSSFSSTRVESSEDLMIRNKRLRDEHSSSYLERFSEAVTRNPHRVFFVEDVEQADYSSQMGIKRAIETGMIKSSSRREVSLSDAIIILSCESLCSKSRACSPPTKQKFLGDGTLVDQEEEMGLSLSLDLNISCDNYEDANENRSIDDIGLIEYVDRRIVFKDPICNF